MVNLVIVKQVLNDLLAVASEEEWAEFQQKLDQLLREFPVAILRQRVSIDFSIGVGHDNFSLRPKCGLGHKQLGVGDDGEGVNEIVRGGSGGVGVQDKGGLLLLRADLERALAGLDALELLREEAHC